jgi:RHS repeat-associated protein
LGIIDTTGDYVVKYSYTAYGECSITYDAIELASINPFRYKGYYYDAESGMYYCHARFYVPEWCRWLSPDSIAYFDPENLCDGLVFGAKQI